MRLLLIVGLLVLACGCTHTRPVPLGDPAGRADLNARTAGRVATITVRGIRHAARDLHAGPDETTWTDRFSGRPQAAQTADVTAVSVRRGRPWRAALIGAGIGAAVGALAAATDDGACGGFFCLKPTPVQYIGLFGMSGGMVGAGVGSAQSERFVNGRSPAGLVQMRLDSLARP